MIDRVQSLIAIAQVQFGVLVVAASYGNVGRSRALAVDAGLDDVFEHPEAVWLAMTDADGTVPPGWLREHLRAARIADVYVGAVVPELDALDAGRRRAWWDKHPPGATLGHVHGANLGMRASAYHAVGGFEPRATAEDVDLVARLRARGFAVDESERHPVVTSSRLHGRAPGGYADYLAALLP